MVDVEVKNSITQHPMAPPLSKSTLSQRIRALDRRRDLISNYIPFVVGSPNDEGASTSLGGVVVGQAETSFVRSTVLNCTDEDRKPVFELVDLCTTESSTNVVTRSTDDRCCNSSRYVLRMCVDAVHYRRHPRSPRSTPLLCSSSGEEEVMNSTKELLSFEQRRTKALEYLTLHLLTLNLIPRIHTDVYPLSNKPLYDGGTVMARINRSASPYLGVISVGVHLHCYTVTDENDERGGGRVEALWLAQRAPTKAHYPNLWDTTVAGGQPYDRSLFDNMIKEAHEEAGVPEEWIRDVYCRNSDDGNPVPSPSPRPPSPSLNMMTAKADGGCMKPSVYYSYDLCVPRGWTPTPMDGEVSRFELFSMDRLREEVVIRFGRDNSSALRPAMGPVLLDFMIRHEVLTKENEVDFDELKQALYGGKDVVEEGMYYGVWG